MHYFSVTGGEAMTVSALNQFIAGIFEDTDLLRNVTVRGEISNFKHHSSGHMYFSIKDENSLIRAVMFKSAASTLQFKPTDGMKVIFKGSVSVYPRDGQYQLYVRSMIPDGIGALYEAYERLKKQLEAEGLFAPEKKRPLPRFPKCIGIITSATGAAVRDMINVLTRRYPLCKILLCPAEVQGQDAPRSLRNALRILQKNGSADLIIIGRGGGSIEDLWAFNDEALVREVASCLVPIISAVGHETDFTLCDFAADLRAPTPSAAAELAVPDIKDINEWLISLTTRFNYAIKDKIRSAKREVDFYANRSCFLRPMTITAPLQLLLSKMLAQIKHAYENKVNTKKSDLATWAAKVDSLSPLRILARGYAITTNESETRISSVNQLKAGDKINLTYADGSAYATIEEINND